MARKPVVLITGANGEMGHALIQRLHDERGSHIVALDVEGVDAQLVAMCVASLSGDVLDESLLERLVSEFEIRAIFHLAALLSTRAEFTPETAHEVNTRGTLNLLKLAVEQSRWHGRRVKFLFPSSIAVYGLPDLETKAAAGRIREEEWNLPTTMYGCNKLYCEHLGRYFTHFYRQLAVEDGERRVDFRSIRFPGLISAFTVPRGGTSDYGPEMVHSAARGGDYACFVREDTRIPFMTMPDAIEALLRLMDAPRDGLSSHVYNVASFNPSAGEFAEIVRARFPRVKITFEVDRRRQAIVDSWPEDVDDSRARREWGFAPRHDLDGAFEEYLLPSVRQLYAKPQD